ncbi:MAG: hypothetical protein NVSMB48_27690 [Marmoricola sp.]
MHDRLRSGPAGRRAGADEPTTPPTTNPVQLYREREGVYSSDLLVVAVAELDFFSWLSRQPGDLAAICAGLDLEARAADVMCTLFTAMGLVVSDGGVFHTTPLAKEHLVAGSPYDLRPYFASLRERPACAELLQVLRTGRTAAWASAATDADWAARLDDAGFGERFTAAMDARGRYLAPLLARVLDDLPCTRLLDIAGGSGIYACALVDRRPGLRASVLERPPVDDVARATLAGRGYADRVGVVTGDMLREPLPHGFDLHLVSHTLHDWDEASVRALLAASFRALSRGGWLVDHDAHIDADKAGPLEVARYSVLLMHSTLGKCWSVAELEAMLTDVGFKDVQVRTVAADRTAVIARKPW